MPTSLFPSLNRTLTALGVTALCSLSSFAASPSWLTAHDAEIKALLAKMTLEEKAGQMTQPNYKDIRDLADIKKYGFGSVLSGGSSDPKTGNGQKDWEQMVRECMELSRQTRLGIPMIYGVDAVHGHNNVHGAVIFPHNIGLGATRNPALIQKISEITAKETRATGIHWIFAPCVAVPRDIRWGRTYEGYSEDPALVTQLGVAAVRGLQGADLTGPHAAIASVKHAIADGGTQFVLKAGKPAIDQGDAVMDEATLRSIHLPPYPATIDAGAGTIMVSFSSWNGVKLSGHKYLLTDVIKKELGFEGFLISDYNAIDQLVPATDSTQPLESNNASGQVVTRNYKQCVEIAINAGMDMVMLTKRYEEFIRSLVELVNEGRVPMSRVDDAVTRILRVKYAAGLMKKDFSTQVDAKLEKEFGSEEHRAVARQAVRESLVLLNKVLPLSSSTKRIHVAGRGADDLGMQCGGWTIDWQGKLGADIPGGTTILAALRKAVGSSTEVTVSRDGTGAAGASVAVVVVGEPPYAESKGDRAELSLDKDDLATIANAKASGVPVVLVLLTGRPMILGDVVDQCDAIVAAWLPGTEGAGVTDILFGKASPTGKLSFTWPRSMEQIPVGTSKEAPLYPLGFGLTY